MRHTYATYLYEYTSDIKFASNSLGHTKTSNTDKYVHIAECMEQQLNGNLFNMALKPHDFGYVGEQPKKQLKMGYSQNRAQLKVFSPVSRYGLIRAQQCFQIENFGLNTKNTPNSKFSAFSLKSFFFSFF